MWNFVSVFGTSNNRRDSDQWRDQLLCRFIFPNAPDLQLWQFSVKWNACSTTHFSCPEQFFSHLKWDFKNYTFSKAGKKKEKSQSGSVITIQPSTGQFPYTSSSQSPTRVAFCCCQKGSWSTWCSSNYSLPSSRFLPMPHLFLSPLCPFSLPAVTSAEAVFSPSIAAQQTGKHCR